MVAEIFGMDAPIIVIVVVAVIFGANKIPQIARSLGSAKNQFAEGQKQTSTDIPDASSTKESSSIS